MPSIDWGKLQASCDIALQVLEADIGEVIDIELKDQTMKFQRLV